MKSLVTFTSTVYILLLLFCFSSTNCLFILFLSISVDSSLMEPAHIDWKRIDSRFVEDVFYEHIRAPKWFNFLAPNHLDTIDDDAWFCKPDCNHPKRPEDFFLTPTSSKHPSMRDMNENLVVTEQNQRRRGHASTSNNQESENQNPNLATPPSYQAKSWRAGNNEEKGG